MRHSVKTYGELEVYVQAFLSSALRWRRVVSFFSRPLYPRGKDPSTHWRGGRVGPKADLDAVAKRKNFFPVPVWNRIPVVQLLAQSVFDLGTRWR